MQLKILRIVIFFAVCSLVHTTNAEPAAQTITATQFSDEDKGELGKSMAQMATQGANQATPDQPLSNNNAGAIMKGLQQVPPPKVGLPGQRAGYDPPVTQAPDTCERDYRIPCPQLYIDIGDPHGNGSIVCSPGPLYDGPCAGSDFEPTKMSETAKRVWSTRCMTNWTCKGCSRHFGKLCPDGWLQKEGSMYECEPGGEYRGPCAGYDMNFSGFNAEMKRRWSDKCLAWWPCESATAQVTEGPDADFPITRKATVWRMLKGYQ